MLNLLTKTKPWMVASLLVATAVFGQDSGSSMKSNGSKPAAKSSCAKPDCAPAKKDCAPCPQPCPPTQMCPAPCNPCCPPWPVPVLNAAYSYPARTTTRCPWDIYFDASFIYWQPMQDNMDFAFVNATTTTATVLDGSVSTVSYSFKPGFKIGFGIDFDYDNWDLHAEYTWFHNSQNESVSAGTGEDIKGMWVVPASSAGTNSDYNAASQDWKLHMDIADLDLGRWGYVGTKFTFRPSFGLRGAWIRQNVTVDYSQSTVTTAEATITGKSHSWAVGPKVEVDTNWVIGCGFRIYGNVESDLLYTRYTRLSLNESTTSTAGAVTDQLFSSQRSVGTVRAHSSVEMGFGYGTYWDCNNWYTDLAVGYQFQAFFDQNMFRNFESSTVRAHSFVPNGNLYTQGLNVTFRLDF